jgi:hypothetical protein
MNIPHTTKRIFLSYTLEDKVFRDFIYEQEISDKHPFEIVEMLPNNPWDPEWSNFCSARVKGCDGAVFLISEHTRLMREQLYEIECAIKENIPYVCLSIRRTPPPLPSILKNCPLKPWSWEEIKNFVEQLNK